MDRASARQLHTGILLDKVRQDRYPSNAHMDLIEAVVGPEQLDDYLEALLEKVASERYPSIPMLRRAQRVIGAFPVRR
jgi:hypothetical protein